MKGGFGFCLCGAGAGVFGKEVWHQWMSLLRPIATGLGLPLEVISAIPLC